MKDSDTKALAEKAEINASKNGSLGGGMQKTLKDMSNRLGVDLFTSLMTKPRVVHDVDTSVFMATVRERAARDAASGSWHTVHDPLCAKPMFDAFKDGTYVHGFPKSGGTGRFTSNAPVPVRTFRVGTVPTHYPSLLSIHRPSIHVQYTYRLPLPVVHTSSNIRPIHAQYAPDTNGLTLSLLHLGVLRAFDTAWRGNGADSREKDPALQEANSEIVTAVLTGYVSIAQLAASANAFTSLDEIVQALTEMAAPKPPAAYKPRNVLALRFLVEVRFLTVTTGQHMNIRPRYPMKFDWCLGLSQIPTPTFDAPGRRPLVIQRKCTTYITYALLPAFYGVQVESPVPLRNYPIPDTRYEVHPYSILKT